MSEWFGHRLYPHVVSTASSLRDQRNHRCPFLSGATGEPRECIKTPAARGVCTISSTSNGPRQDWVVCPYRAFDRSLMEGVARRLFDIAGPVWIHAAPGLATPANREDVVRRLGAGERVLVYFDQKMGGEIQVRPTERSPQIAFDTTFVELVDDGGRIGLGRFGVLEIQTMDFHGSYRKAVSNLQSALRLHEHDFPAQVQANPRWLAERIEGPNIANVFKRTFWQMMFKFEMAAAPFCAGVALAIPSAVWDSWQKFLGAPRLELEADGVSHLPAPRAAGPDQSAWIYVFDFDAEAETTPSPMRLDHIIRTNADALSHHALVEAPKGAIETLNAGIHEVLRRRLREYWPLELELPVRQDAGAAAKIVIAEDERTVEEIVHSQTD